MTQFVFNSDNFSSFLGIKDGLKQLYKTSSPVILCVGSDLVVGDSLGPFIGTELLYSLMGKAYVYGTLKSPITAKECDFMSAELKKMHPNSKILVIDAAVGKEQDVGLIKLSDCGIKPGLGVNKDLMSLGDVSIIGIVASKNTFSLENTDKVRFSLVYKMAKIISAGILEFFK